jgi:hypothetical protein
MKSASIVGLCILAAVVYGIVHDQITARVCVEYFTIGHPPVFPTESPTLLGLGWGVIATWWVGLGLGLPLALAARSGPGPKRDAQSLVRPIAQLFAVMGVSATITGIVGYSLARAQAIQLVGWLAESVPADRHARFLADGWAHGASYLVGFVGGLVVVGRVWRSRRTERGEPAISSPGAPAAARDSS